MSCLSGVPTARPPCPLSLALYQSCTGRATKTQARGASHNAATYFPPALSPTPRNYPNCKYGNKCAFAHSKAELRRLSLEEMVRALSACVFVLLYDVPFGDVPPHLTPSITTQEQAGRIPDARKYRVYPCLTWLSTGACPYNDRCVFIHDPRIRGERPAYLYATPGSNATRHSAKASPLFWPDLPVSECDNPITASPRRQWHGIKNNAHRA